MREQRLVFGEVAELYDRVRPSYPDPLVDDVVDLVGAPACALDVGSGTGRAAVLRAARGLEGVALEPDPAIAAVARRRLRGFPGWRVELGEFERFLPRPGVIPTSAFGRRDLGGDAGEGFDLVWGRRPGTGWIRGHASLVARPCSARETGWRVGGTGPLRIRVPSDPPSTGATSGSHPRSPRTSWPPSARPATRSTQPAVPTSTTTCAGCSRIDGGLGR